MEKMLKISMNQPFILPMSDKSPFEPGFIFSFYYCEAESEGENFF